MVASLAIAMQRTTKYNILIICRYANFVNIQKIFF